MVLEILLAAVLIAFGISAIYFSIEEDVHDTRTLIMLLIGMFAFIGGGWIVLTHVPLVVLLVKIAGLILLGIGLFLITGFPSITQYQPEGMSKAGVFIGLIIMLFGVFLLIT